jgi:hypothetical protein
MISHRFILEKSPYAGEWLLEWDPSDDGMMTLRGPEGQLLFEAPRLVGCQIIDVYELADGKVSIRSPAGVLTFKKNKEAARDLRELIKEALRCDPAFRRDFRLRAKVMLPIGVLLLVFCGGLFGLYCWYASWAPDPPKGHWIYYIGGLIHLALIFLLAGAIIGPIIIWRSLRQLWSVRKIERAKQ